MKFVSRFLFFSLCTTVALASDPQPQTAAKKTGVAQKIVQKKNSGAAVKAGPASAGTAKATGARAVASGKTSSPSTKTVGSKKRTATGRKTVQRASVVRQATPTPDRYKEIQQALAAKGYLKSEPTGVWDADSVAAMRQFQTDRNQDPSGKLTAAALIDLGLGPQPETAHAPVTGSGEAEPEPPAVETAPAQRP